MKPATKPALALMALLLCAPLWAQNPQLAGILGSKALIVQGGGAPRALAVGESANGVRVIAVGRDDATVEVAGEQRLLRLGEAAVSVGERESANPILVLQADAGGHFINDGSINGKPMRFMVDTGATTVALGRAQAQRLGVDLTAGQPVRMQTANGTATGWRVTLQSVRIGPLQQNQVSAVITEQAMPYVLLGNSFLQPYEMTRKGSELTLRKR